MLVLSEILLFVFYIYINTDMYIYQYLIPL